MCVRMPLLNKYRIIRTNFCRTYILRIPVVRITYIPMQLHFLCITSSSDTVTPLNSDIRAHILRAQVTVSSNRSRRLVHVACKRWPVDQTYWLKGVAFNRKCSNIGPIRVSILRGAGENSNQLYADRCGRLQHG